MKNYLILLMLTGCSLFAFGQPKDFKTELYIGARGGMSYSKVRFYPSVTQSYQPGNMGGVVFRLISEPHIGFQVEVNYIQKGWKEDSVGYSRQLNYINIPVMTHVSLGKKAVRFTLNLGPEVGYMISEKEKFTPELASETSGYQEYYGKATDNQIDLLFTAGLGLEYHMKGGSAIVFEGRAYYSLPNLFNKDNYTYTISQSNGAMVSIAYLFELKKKKKY